LVEIEGDAAVEVEDVVFGDHRAVAGGQIVDRAAILEMRLGVVDAVIGDDDVAVRGRRSEEHTSELQSLMRISYAVFCLKKKTKLHTYIVTENTQDKTTN